MHTASKLKCARVALYYLLCACAWLLLVLPLLYLSTKPKYRRSIPARFFPFVRSNGGGFCKDFSPHIWIHACSFGEMKSLEPIIRELCKHTKGNILLTTTTQTGFDLANTYALEPRIRAEFLPFEIFLPFYKPRLKQLQSLAITEAELWLGLLHTAKSLGVQSLLINARISTRSYPKYRRFQGFYRLLFSYVDQVFAQSQADKDRLSTLGAQHIEVFGNLKLLSPITISKAYPKPNRLALIAASTHKGEEELVLQAFSALKKLESKSLLILAPRHPERFAQVATLLASYPFKSARFTQDSTALENPSLDIILLDTLGELNNCYAIADIVILGGAFAKAGGHNPLEPAFFHTKLISGTAIFNQEALFACIDGYVLCEASELESTLLAHQSLPHTAYKDAQANLATLVRAILKPTPTPIHKDH